MAEEKCFRVDDDDADFYDDGYSEEEIRCVFNIPSSKLTPECIRGYLEGPDSLEDNDEEGVCSFILHRKDLDTARVYLNRVCHADLIGYTIQRNTDVYVSIWTDTHSAPKKKLNAWNDFIWSKDKSPWRKHVDFERVENGYGIIHATPTTSRQMFCNFLIATRMSFENTDAVETWYDLIRKSEYDEYEALKFTSILIKSNDTLYEHAGGHFIFHGNGVSANIDRLRDCNPNIMEDRVLGVSCELYSYETQEKNLDKYGDRYYNICPIWKDDLLRLSPKSESIALENILLQDSAIVYRGDHRIFKKAHDAYLYRMGNAKRNYKEIQELARTGKIFEKAKVFKERIIAL